MIYHMTYHRSNRYTYIKLSKLLKDRNLKDGKAGYSSIPDDL